MRRDGDRRFVLANYFFRRWLEEMSANAEVPAAALDSAGAPTAGSSRGELRILADATLTLGVALGEIDGRYELLEELGTGATGVVYNAYDTQLKVKIAIKVLKPEYSTTSASSKVGSTSPCRWWKAPPSPR